MATTTGPAHPGATFMGPPPSAAPQVTQRSGIQNTTQNTTTSSRTYIDVPTPEEFLDNFQNAFATHLANQVQNGGLSHQAAQWAMAHPQNFLDQYTAHLGQMAQAGQPIFKAFAPTDAPTFLGTRQGQVSNTQVVGTVSGNTTSTSGPAPSVGAAPAPAQGGVGQPLGAVATGGVASQQPPAMGAAATGGVQTSYSTATRAAPTPMGAVAIGPGPSVVSQPTIDIGTTNTNTNQTGSTNDQENLYSRPNATVLHALSPSDFLSQNAGADSLSLAYEGSKGESQYSRDKVQRQSGGTRMLS